MTKTEKARVRTLKKLRATVRKSKHYSLILDRAVIFYNRSKNAFLASRSAKDKNAPFNQYEIRCMAETEIIQCFVIDLGVTDQCEVALRSGAIKTY